ncbi:MAG TPA: hypothetical protein VHZ99_13550 [Steroidobacteraceae bacterium]|jgi:hypothetical protein|nr:hypothetical protein [Steroidobacteraceae bacterium]
MEPRRKPYMDFMFSSDCHDLGVQLRARAALHQAEAYERRQVELAGQTANMNSPAERIAIWERIHQVALPHDPAHQVLHVIAADTALNLEQVRSEQSQRQALRAARQP